MAICDLEKGNGHWTTVFSKTLLPGNSLTDPWLRHGASTAGGTGLAPGLATENYNNRLKKKKLFCCVMALIGNYIDDR